MSLSSGQLRNYAIRGPPVNRSDLIGMAIALARQSVPNDGRTYRLACTGQRADGTLVYARNGHAVYPTPGGHAEARLCRKLDLGSRVCVARVRRDGLIGMAMPCRSCATRMRARGVIECCYTISDTEYGIIRWRRY